MKSSVAEAFRSCQLRYLKPKAVASSSFFFTVHSLSRLFKNVKFGQIVLSQMFTDV